MFLMTEKSISIRAEFQYYYKPEAGDGCGSEYKCPQETIEKFLETFGMKDIGVCPWHSGYRMAEKIFEVPLKGALPPARIDIEYILRGRTEPACFDKKYSPVEITTKMPGGAAPNEDYYFLWIEERKEWVCFHEEACHLWESGTFNQRMTGPYSIDKTIEEQISQVLKDAEQIERSFKFSFETINPRAISWLYSLMKEQRDGINPARDIVISNEAGEKWDISSMGESSLINICKTSTEYTASICGSMDEVNHYLTLIDKAKDLAKFMEWADKIVDSKKR